MFSLQTTEERRCIFYVIFTVQHLQISGPIVMLSFPSLSSFPIPCRPYSDSTMSKWQQPPPSHPTTHRGDCEKNFESVIKTLSQGVRNSTPSAIPYSSRVILGLRWSNDDLDLAKPQAALLETFRTQYGFETASLLIPSTSGEEALGAIDDTIFKLRQEYKLDNPYYPPKLFVIHYIGHGVSETERKFEIW